MEFFLLNKISILIYLAVAVVLYFLPGLVALNRCHKDKTAIWILNFFLGWTFLGWVVALAWSCMHVEKKEKQETEISKDQENLVIDPNNDIVMNNQSEINKIKEMNNDKTEKENILKIIDKIQSAKLMLELISEGKGINDLPKDFAEKALKDLNKADNLLNQIKNESFERKE